MKFIFLKSAIIAFLMFVVCFVFATLIVAETRESCRTDKQRRAIKVYLTGAVVSLGTLLVSIIGFIILW